jgi:small-conductance mechanosensitive channel
VVSAVLAEIGEEICQDEVYRERILAPLEIMGVHELGDSAVVIRSKIKTKPMMQFSVRREFYRRIKHRFDALGIEIPFPHQTVYFGEKKEADPALEQYRGTSAGSTERHADGSGTDTGSP